MNIAQTREFTQKLAGKLLGMKVYPELSFKDWLKIELPKTAMELEADMEKEPSAEGERLTRVEERYDVRRRIASYKEALQIGELMERMADPSTDIILRGPERDALRDGYLLLQQEMEDKKNTLFREKANVTPIMKKYARLLEALNIDLPTLILAH